MKATKWSRRTVYVAAIVAMIASTSGFALASVLSVSPVYQGASFYQGNSNGALGFSAPSLNISATPNGVATCSSPSTPTTDAVSGGVADLYFSFHAGAMNCTAGHFAEVFNFTYAATITTQEYSITIYSQIGANTIQTNHADVVLGTGTSSHFTATILVYVDYGSVNPPTAGINELNIAVDMV